MIDVIIPVYNLEKRGLNRVYYSIFSLKNQLKHPNNIYVIDGSTKEQYNTLHYSIRKLRVNHIYYPTDGFNKPILHNHGIKKSNQPYVLCTDADYLFKRDFILECLKNVDENKLLLKEVMNLPKVNITESRITAWMFPKGSPYKFMKNGKNLANGGVQLASREWMLDIGGYDERMSGWGGMDNDLVNRAIKSGKKVQWMKTSEVLHQWHVIQKNKTREDQKKFDRNQHLLKTDKSIIKNDMVHDTV